MGIVNLARALGALVLSLAAPAAADTSFVMVEQPGCAYCARWNAEIGPIWPETDLARRAPLRRVDLRDLPEDIDFESPPRLTPTFVLVRDGAEVSRMEGYTGDEFFWVVAERMFEEAGIPPAAGQHEN